MRAAISVLRRLSKLKTRRLLNDGPVEGTKTILNHEGHEVHEVVSFVVKTVLVSRDHAVRRVGVQIGFFAVLADIQPTDLVRSGRTQRDQQPDQFREYEADDEAVSRRAGDGD